MTDCISWSGLTGNHGYGRAYIPSTTYGAKDNREALAHRLVYEEEYGPIPAGMQVHHRCENPTCINVEHLHLLDGRHHAGGHGHGTLTMDTARQIKSLLAEGWRGVDVAAAFGVSKQQVCNIRKGRCWA